MEKQGQEKPFHVVYIITKLELGGAQKICLSLMSGMEKSACSTTLITGAEGPLVPQARLFDSVYFLEEFKREISVKGVWRELKTFFTVFKLLRHLKKEHKDKKLIVHTHSTKAGLVGRWAAFFARIPQRIHTIHGYGFHDYQSRTVWWFIYLAELMTSFITTHFICVSEKDRQRGVKLFPRFAKKSSLIRAAVSWDQFYQPALKTKMLPLKVSAPFRIGTISCFKPQKNLFDLFKAFESVCSLCRTHNHPLPELQVIGDGEMRPAFEQWIAEHSMQKQIVLLGWQPDVSLWMRGWHLFVLSSLWEGLPCAVIEARLCKLPVLAYSIGGIPEIIRNGENGYLINPSDWPELSRLISSVLHDRILYQTLSSFRDELSEFDHRVMWKKHVSLYRDLAEK